MDERHDDAHCDACWDAVRVLSLRAEFQGQAMKWMAVLAPTIIGITSLVLAVTK